MNHLMFLISFILFMAGNISPAPAQTMRSQSAENLLLLQKNDSTVQTITTPEQWQVKKAAIVTAMQALMGPFPSSTRRIHLDVKVEEESDAGTYVRRLITYQSEPDSRTPAYLCIPKDVLAGERSGAAVLCLHPTDNTVGHRVVVGLGGLAGRQYAAELAEHGYVTLSPAYPHLANYWPNLGKLGYVSGTMKAIWDNSRGLDLLQSLDFVDSANGFAAIGHSLGGHNAIYTAAFDDRISAIVSSCGFDSYNDYMDGTTSVWMFEKGWCQIRYMPRLSNYRDNLNQIPFDFPEILAALAPRMVFVNAPIHDSNFRWKSVDKCITTAMPVYKLLGAENKMRVVHPDCDHNFPDTIRKAAYQAIDDVLKPK